MPRVIDESNELLQLHLQSLIALFKADKAHALTQYNMFKPDDIGAMFELLVSDTSGSHSNCCLKAAQGSWTAEALKHAQTVLFGKSFQVILERSPTSDYYNCELTDTESGENIITQLTAHNDISNVNLGAPFSSDRAYDEISRVVHVLSPDWVYLQEITEDSLTDLSKCLVDHYTSLMESPVEPGVTGDVVVKIRKDFVCRAVVVEWCSEEEVEVFAIDYGWTVRVRIGNVVASEDYLMELPAMAKLAHIQNLSNNNVFVKVQQASLKVLQSFYGHSISANVVTDRNIDILVKTSQFVFLWRKQVLIGRTLIEADRDKQFICSKAIYKCSIFIYLFDMDSAVKQFKAAGSVAEMSEALKEINARFQKVSLSHKDVLHGLVYYIHPDSMPRVIDESSELLQLHLQSLIALFKADKAHALTQYNMFKPDDIGAMFELLVSDTSGSHSNCCLKAAQGSWTAEALKHAQSVLFGKSFQVILERSPTSDYYNCELTDTESGENIITQLTAHSDISNVNLGAPFSADRAYDEISRVVHVLSPDWVYLQEITEDSLTDLSKCLVDHYTSLMESPVEPGVTGDVVVKIRKDFVCRAVVVEWCSEEEVEVFAIDYGWTVRVRIGNHHRSLLMDYLDGRYRFEAHIQNLSNNNVFVKVQQASLKVLQSFYGHSISANVVTDRNIDILKQVIETSNSAAVMFEVLLLLTQMKRYNRPAVSMF
eukprot:sb/3462556/